MSQVGGREVKGEGRRKTRRAEGMTERGGGGREGVTVKGGGKGGEAWLMVHRASE